MEANQEALPDPGNEHHIGGSSENSSTTRSIARISLDVNAIQNQNISTNLENINRNQENLSRRLGVMEENISSLTENLARLTQNLTENYDNLTTKFSENREEVSKMKDNFKRIYGRKNGFE